MLGEKLAGRVALVTGGTRGIGAAICRSLASQGASVAAGYSAHKDRADAFMREFEQDYGPGRATTHQGNVSHPEDCRRVVQVRRLCHPQEIARLVHFLAADAPAYITGQVWGVNGGLDM